MQHYYAPFFPSVSEAYTSEDDSMPAPSAPPYTALDSGGGGSSSMPVPPAPPYAPLGGGSSSSSSSGFAPSWGSSSSAFAPSRGSSSSAFAPSWGSPAGGAMGREECPLAESEVRLGGSSAPAVAGLAGEALRIVQRGMFWSRHYQLVLRNPRWPDRGVVMFEGSAEDARRAAVNVLSNAAHEIDGTDVSPTMYDDLLHTPKLRSSFASQRAVPAYSPASPLEASSSIAEEAAPSSAPPDSFAGQQEAPAAEAEEHECPICFDCIAASDGVLRCVSAPCHYFHQNCLRAWIAECRRGQRPTCPMCRQGLQVHGARLEEFLNGNASADLSEEDRGFLQNLLKKLPYADTWTDVLTLENLEYYGGIMAAAGWGFFNGYRPQNRDPFLGLLFHELPSHLQVAQVAGYVVGSIARVVRDEAKTELDNRRRRS